MILFIIKKYMDIHEYSQSTTQVPTASPKAAMSGACAGHDDRPRATPPKADRPPRRIHSRRDRCFRWSKPSSMAVTRSWTTAGKAFDVTSFIGDRRPRKVTQGPQSRNKNHPQQDTHSNRHAAKQHPDRKSPAKPRPLPVSQHPASRARTDRVRSQVVVSWCRRSPARTPAGPGCRDGGSGHLVRRRADPWRRRSRRSDRRT